MRKPRKAASKPVIPQTHDVVVRVKLEWLTSLIASERRAAVEDYKRTIRKTRSGQNAHSARRA